MQDKRKPGRPTENKKDDIIRFRCTSKFKDKLKKEGESKGFKSLTEYVEYLLNKGLEK